MPLSNETRISIRLATPADVEGIRRVYAPYIATPITFEEEVPAPAGYSATMEQVMLFYPCLVACTDEAVVGFAYAHRQAERAAYDWNTELSVYLEEGVTRSGVGSALYRALLDLLALQGIRAAYARVTLPNPASEHLHARFAFETMGVQKNAGFKDGAWRDVAWFTKQIGPYDAAPEKPLPFPAVMAKREEAVRRIIEEANRELR